MTYLPRSSVAAVLAHRLELGIDDEQVRRLEAIDDQLQRQNAALTNRPAPGSAAGPVTAPGGSPPGDARPGSGSAGEGMGRHRGGRRGVPGRAGPGDERRDAVRTADDNDTAAYLQAEQVLRPEQRDRAREIAERYREELYDQRAAKRPP